VREKTAKVGKTQERKERRSEERYGFKKSDDERGGKRGMFIITSCYFWIV